MAQTFNKISCFISRQFFKLPEQLERDISTNIPQNVFFIKIQRSRRYNGGLVWLAAPE